MIDSGKWVVERSLLHMLGDPIVLLSCLVSTSTWSGGFGGEILHRQPQTPIPNDQPVGLGVEIPSSSTGRGHAGSGLES